MTLARHRRTVRLAVFFALVAVAAGRAAAAEALVAVAANFAEVAGNLEPGFESETGHALTVSVGSTGKLYAQIKHGAPYDVLLAADRERPRRLVEEGLAVAGSRFTYATGRLTLWSAVPNLIGEDGTEILRRGGFRRLALANPKLAPYGAAARQVMRRLGLWQVLGDRLVMGENVGQAFAMIASGNAELGFVALSQVLSPRNATSGSRWDVPVEFYEPLRQDAVLLVRAADNGAARAFLAYLKSPSALALIERSGYGPTPDGTGRGDGG